LSVVLRDHLLELVGDFIGACEHDRLVARFDLTTETELETLQTFGRERLQALQLLRILVHAVVFESAKRREDLFELLRIDVEAAQHAAQILRLIGPLPRFRPELPDVFVRQLAPVAAVVRPIPRQVSVAVAAAVVDTAVEAVLIAKAVRIASLRAALLATTLLATGLLATLLPALALLAVLALLAILALLAVLALLALTLLALTLLPFLALLIASLLAALVGLATLIALLIAALLIARIRLRALARPLLE
jgi:hypothetical protein